MDASTANRQGDPLAIAEEWLASGRQVAIATVVDTWGSAPRPIGSHLVIDGEGNDVGTRDLARAFGFYCGLCCIDHLEASQAWVVWRSLLL